MPLSAVVANEKLWGRMKDDPYFRTATFAGHPLSCAAGLGALETILTAGPQLRETKHRLARLLREAANSAGTSVVRAESTGLFGVIDFSNAEMANAVMARCARSGLLLAPCMTWPPALRALPSCTVTPEEWQEATDILVGTITKVRSMAA